MSEQAPRSGRWHGVAAFLVYLAGAVLVTIRLWASPNGRIIAENFDQTFFEWALTHAARSVTGLTNPLATTMMNAPDGVNMMANTSMLAISIPLAPVTLTLGPAVAFVTALTLGLTLTAFAWYAFLAHYLATSRIAAAAGGAFCGFAPAMVSHTNGHPNLVGQFLIPVIVWRTLELRHRDRNTRNGVLLGLAVAVQAFINEELLLLTALALGIFLLCLLPTHRSAVTPVLRGTGVAAAVAGAILAYPLWHQFTGAGSYSGAPDWFKEYRTDAFSYLSYPIRSLAGEDKLKFGLHAAEQNGNYGLPLVILVAGIVIWLRRDRIVVALAVTGLTAAVFSLGGRLIVRDTRLPVPLPWGALNDLPLLESVLPARWAMVTVPVVGVLLALGIDRARRISRAGTFAAVALALIPLLPTPVPAVDREPVPRFFAEGRWRAFAGTGDSVVSVPPALVSERGAGALAAMHWSTSQGHAFPISEGFYLGPDPFSPDREAIYGERFDETSYLIWWVWQHNTPLPVTGEQRRAARERLDRINAGIVVMPVNLRHAAAVRTTLDDLLGPGLLVDDVFVWKAP